MRFPVTLAVLAAVAGGGLALVEAATQERIAENKKRKLDAAFRQVPGFAEARELRLSAEARRRLGLDEEEAGYELLGADGAAIGRAAQVKCTAPRCYNAREPIALVVVLDAELRNILLLRTTANKETPGLGTRVSDKAPAWSLASWVGLERMTPPAREYGFLDQFKGREADGLKFGQDGLDAITGATVSSKAVVGGIGKAAGLLKEAGGK
jgi:Na+-translocating ferredoxin:NAD+ oxidoreductase RnfG subunit